MRGKPRLLDGASTNEGAKFEIRVNGRVRTYCDDKKTAFEAARILRTMKGNKEVNVRDVATGEFIEF